MLHKTSKRIFNSEVLHYSWPLTTHAQGEQPYKAAAKARFAVWKVKWKENVYFKKVESQKG